MDRLIWEYIELLGGDDNPSDKFWELEQRIGEDKKKTGVIVRMSWSQFIYDIISLINGDMILPFMV